MIESEIQRKILSKSSFFQKGAKYSELQIEDIENDLYNYHLQKLVKDGFLSKESNLYHLTTKGKSLVTNIDERDLKAPAMYKVSVYLCPIKDGKILLTRRLKHPQYGYVGCIAEKKQYGEELIESAKRALAEETGLTAKTFEVIGDLHQVRKDAEGNVIEDGVFYIYYCKDAEGNVIEDGVFYIYYCKDFEGELTEKSVEGEYFWVELSEVSKLEKIFKPSVEVIVDEVSARLDGRKSWEDKFIYEFLPEAEEY